MSFRRLSLPFPPLIYLFCLSLIPLLQADRLRQYCREVGTLAPVEAILDGHDLANVFKVIVGVCMRPYTALPKREGHDGGEGSSSGFKLGYVLFPLALAALGGAGYWFWWRKKT